MKEVGLAGYFTKSQLARGEVPATEVGRRYAHSYSPEGGWYVLGIPHPFQVGITKGTDHATPFSYDTHVPLAFYGLADGGFVLRFLMFEGDSGECVFVQPGDRIIEVEHVVGFLGVLFREQGIDLFAQSFRIEIGSR